MTESLLAESRNNCTVFQTNPEMYHYGPLTLLYAKVESAASKFFSPVEDESKKPRILVVGYGWAASAFINNLNFKKYRVEVVSSSPARFSQPTMISTWRKNFKPPPHGIAIVDDEVDKVEGGKLVGKKASYDYDYLVVATGSEPNDFGIAGVAQHAQFFKTPSHLDALQSRLDRASTVSVMGAGPTGLELAFKLKALGHDVTVVEAANSILPGFSEEIKRRVLDEVAKKGIRLHLDHKILGVTADAILTSQGNVPLGHRGLAVWTCGVRPTAFARQFPAPDGQLRAGGGDSRVFLIGDAARGRGPPTAQNAKRQGGE